MRYKLSWRMGLEAICEKEHFKQYLDTVTENGCSDEIWIFLSEPTSYCYEPLESIAEKCERYKPLQAMARERGLRVGINPWPSFGADETYQADREKREMPFQPMIGKDGSASRRLACPVSPEFLKWTRERYKLFASTGCDFVWVDDDCRLTHLGGVPYPCFCPKCVADFKNGAFASREELVNALNKPENAQLRYEWSSYGAERLAKYCAVVREAVDEVDPKIETSFMSVGYSHTTFSGDYIEKCTKALRASALRPGHGFYWDDKPMGIFEKAMDMSRQVVNAPEFVKADVQYEEESCPSTPWNKAFQTRVMEAALSIWGGCTGIAFNHMFNAGGPAPFGWLRAESKLLKQARPFFDRYLSFAHDLPQSGVWAAFSEFKAARMKVTEDGWFHEYDSDYNENMAVAEWPTFGFPITADPSNAFATLFSGKAPYLFSETELRELLKKPAFADGKALEALWDMGMGESFGVKPKFSYIGTGVMQGGEFDGAARSGIGDFSYALDVLDENVRILEQGQQAFGVQNGPCMTTLNGKTVLGDRPYRFTGTPAYIRCMQEQMVELGARVYTAGTDIYVPLRVSTWAREDGQRAAVLLINACTDFAPEFEVRFKGTAEKAVSLGVNKEESALPTRRDGEWICAAIDTLAPWEMRLVLFD